MLDLAWSATAILRQFQGLRGRRPQWAGGWVGPGRRRPRRIRSAAQTPYHCLRRAELRDRTSITMPACLNVTGAALDAACRFYDPALARRRASAIAVPAPDRAVNTQRIASRKEPSNPQVRTKVQEHQQDLGPNTYSRGPISSPARNVLAFLSFVERVQQWSFMCQPPAQFAGRKLKSRSRAA